MYIYIRVRTIKQDNFVFFICSGKGKSKRNLGAYLGESSTIIFNKLSIVIELKNSHERVPSGERACEDNAIRNFHYAASYIYPKYL